MRGFARFWVLLAWLLAAPSFAAGQKFDQASFDALLRSGKPTLVMVHADWCPTCRAQAPIVSELLKKPELSVITALRVDFDAQADVVKAFRVTQQSTLIVFKAGHEVGRSIGDTRPESIEALLKRAI
jgi:thiol-disulfide isomerase/thioredoxin